MLFSFSCLIINKNNSVSMAMFVDILLKVGAKSNNRAACPETGVGLLGTGATVIGTVQKSLSRSGQVCRTQYKSGVPPGDFNSIGKAREQCQ